MTCLPYIPVEVVGNASLCVLGCRGFAIVGTQNVSFTDDAGLRFDERKLVESTVSTLYGMALLVRSASWLNNFNEKINHFFYLSKLIS